MPPDRSAERVLNEELIPGDAIIDPQDVQIAVIIDNNEDETSSSESSQHDEGGPDVIEEVEEVEEQPHGVVNPQVLQPEERQQYIGAQEALLDISEYIDELEETHREMRQSIVQKDITINTMRRVLRDYKKKIEDLETELGYVGIRNMMLEAQTWAQEGRIHRLEEEMERLMALAAEVVNVNPPT